MGHGGPYTAEVAARLVSEIRSHSKCPLTQALTRQTKGDFQRASNLLRDLQTGYESR
jgi:FAD synthase